MKQMDVFQNAQDLYFSPNVKIFQEGVPAFSPKLRFFLNKFNLFAENFIFMTILNEFQKRFLILRDSSQSREKRLFAFLELLCAPLSFLTLFVFLPAMILSRRCEALDPLLLARLDLVLRVLLAASVGYLTNFIALEMIFKPFQPTNSHPLSILTLGYWKQGLVPRNKDQLGEEIGKQVEEKLLDTKEVAGDLCTAILEILQSPRTLETAKGQMREILKTHDARISEFLIPQIEESLAQTVRQLLNEENLRSFWQEVIAPRLDSDEIRQLAAQKLADKLREKTPQFMETLREMVRDYVMSFLQRNPLLGGFGLAEKMAEGFVSFVDWVEVGKKIEDRLCSPSTVDTLGEELVSLGGELQKWFQSPESASRIEGFQNIAQERFRIFMKQYLQENLPRWVEQILESPQLWQWIDSEILPKAQEAVKVWLQNEGQDLIAERLHLAQRVQKAIEKQDVEEFYLMITNVAAQHLGAIQVLGFFLGGIVGLIQLLL